MALLLDDADAYATMARGDSPYGDGGAAQRTISAILGDVVAAFDPSKASDQRR